MNERSDPVPGAGVRFRETLTGLVTVIDHDDSPIFLPLGDRQQSALISDHLIVGSDTGRDRRAVLRDLEISVDISRSTDDGGLAGVIRNGRVTIDDLFGATVQDGIFELFGRVANDGLRMRYAIVSREPSGQRWLIRGTKLVTNEVPGSLMHRLWTETTTLYITVSPVEGPISFDNFDIPKHPPRRPVALGVVRVLPRSFGRQLLSLRGEPVPGGGMEATLRFSWFFLQAARHQYLGRTPDDEDEGGIEAAFADLLGDG